MQTIKENAKRPSRSTKEILKGKDRIIVCPISGYGKERIYIWRDWSYIKTA
jgi:hypothetical protein